MIYYIIIISYFSVLNYLPNDIGADFICGVELFSIISHLIVIINMHQIMMDILDRKFGVKARLSQALQVTLSYVRNHTHTAATRNLQPVLNVLKAYANNGESYIYRVKSQK